MGLEFDASELIVLAKDLGEGPKKLGHLARTVVRKTAKDIEKSAKMIVPVDFGTLKNSITTSDLRSMGTSGSISAEITAGTDYAYWVENGTTRMAAQPYMKPALEKHSSAFEEAMGQIAEQAISGG